MSKKTIILGSAILVGTYFTIDNLTTNKTQEKTQTAIQEEIKVQPKVLSHDNKPQEIKKEVIVKQAIKTKPITTKIKETPTITKQKQPVKKVIITLPKVPEVPKVTAIVPVVETIGGYKITPREELNKRTNHIPHRVSQPPKEVSPAHTPTTKITEKKTTSDVATPVVEKKPATISSVGTNINGRVSTYLRGKILSLDDVKSKLKTAGFTIVSTTTIDKSGNLTSIVFTNKELLSSANKKSREIFASLRLLIDKEASQISITNPLYFSRAYMQDNHDEKLALKLLESLNQNFEGLKNSSDKLKYTLLPKYNFMFGMPEFEDMIDVAKASSSANLIAKLKAYKGGKNLIFTQKISEEKYLVGVKLDKRTSKFIDSTGHQNALLLPYPIMIENGVAKILDPKYYIAISYPMLKMSQFMKIASIPDAIEKDCKKLFN